MGRFQGRKYQTQWPKRFAWGLFEVPLFLVLLILNLSALVFLLPQARIWLYKLLLKSKAFGYREGREKGSISCGLKIWDSVHAYSILVTASSVPILLVVVLWLVADLSTLWQDVTNQASRATVAQLVSAAVLGGVAIDVFLITQLPHLMRPRVFVCFLKNNPQSPERIDSYFEEFVSKLELKSQQTTTLHFRITNTGTSHLSRIDLRVYPPSSIIFTGGQSPGTPPTAIDKYKAWQEGGEGSVVRFAVRDDPSDTAPGASALFRALIVPPKVEEETDYELRLRITSDSTIGFTEKKLQLVVVPNRQ